MENEKYIEDFFMNYLITNGDILTCLGNIHKDIDWYFEQKKNAEFSRHLSNIEELFVNKLWAVARTKALDHDNKLLGKLLDILSKKNKDEVEIETKKVLIQFT